MKQCCNCYNETSFPWSMQNKFPETKGVKKKTLKNKLQKNKKMNKKNGINRPRVKNKK